MLLHCFAYSRETLRTNRPIDDTLRNNALGLYNISSVREYLKYLCLKYVFHIGLQYIYFVLVFQIGYIAQEVFCICISNSIHLSSICVRKYFNKIQITIQNDHSNNNNSECDLRK